MSVSGRLGPGELMPRAGVQEEFFRRSWTDGLPIVPPTEELVGAMLATCGLGFDTIIGTVTERRRTLTAGKVAVNAVMAGCLPEHMPVVVAALRAALQPGFNLHAVSSSTGGPGIFAVVSGPYAERIGMNAGGNAFGPGNRANATIGRAIRLVVMNVLGAVPGLMDATTLGHPGKYTYCIAEADPPSRWPALREEQGYGRAASSVLVFPGEAPRQVANPDSGVAENILLTVLAAMLAGSNFIVGHPSGVGGQFALVLCPEHVETLVQAGWSKNDVRAFLFERAEVSRGAMRAAGRPLPGDDGDVVRVVTEPADIVITTAGGYGGRWSALVPTWARRVTARYAHAEIEEKTPAP